MHETHFINSDTQSRNRRPYCFDISWVRARIVISHARSRNVFHTRRSYRAEQRRQADCVSGHSAALGVSVAEVKGE